MGVLGDARRTDRTLAHYVASREKLDNLIFVGELQFAAAGRAGARQRADHSRAGIGVSRREVECHQGAVGSEWDPILERDTEGLLVKRMGNWGGEYQKLVVSSGLMSASISWA